MRRIIGGPPDPTPRERPDHGVTGTADFDFYGGLLTQLVNVGTQGEKTRRTENELYVGDGEGYWPEGRD